METKHNVTKGEFTLNDYGWKTTDDYGKPVFSGDIRDEDGFKVWCSAAFGMSGKTPGECKGNAILFTDALNTHNTTGYTPSQLLEQNREIVEALRELPVLLIEASDLIELIDPPRNGSSVHSPKLLSTAKFIKELLTKHSKDV